MLLRATITVNIAQTIVMFKSGYKPILITASFALENVMTCRVHRAVILGLIADGQRQTGPLLTTVVLETDDMMLRDHGLAAKQYLGYTM